MYIEDLIRVLEELHQGQKQINEMLATMLKIIERQESEIMHLRMEPRNHSLKKPRIIYN